MCTSLLIFSVVYCLHTVAPFKCAAKPHRQQRPPTWSNSSASSPEESFPSYRWCDRFFRLVAVSRVGWSKLRKWALPGQGGHAAQCEFRDTGYYQQTSVLCVCVSEKSASFVDMTIVEFKHQLFIHIPAIFFFVFLLPSHLWRAAKATVRSSIISQRIAHEGVGEMLFKDENHEW